MTLLADNDAEYSRRVIIRWSEKQSLSKWLIKTDAKSVAAAEKAVRKIPLSLTDAKPINLWCARWLSTAGMTRLKANIRQHRSITGTGKKKSEPKLTLQFKQSTGKKLSLYAKRHKLTINDAIERLLDIETAELRPTATAPASQTITHELQPAITRLTPREYKGHSLTHEQNTAVELSCQGEDMKVEARAGSGKTYTLAGISHFNSQRKGIYVAFNRAIAQEASESFPSNTTCKTAHSFAYRALGHIYKDAGRLQRISGAYLSQSLGINARIAGLSMSAIGNLILTTIARYCHSADEQITLDNAPWSALAKFEDKVERKAVADEIVKLAQRAWERMSDINDSMQITHDVYLKCWALSKPTLRADWIMVDESQDSNPVLIDLISQQKNCQKIWVGDRFQSIYSWRGAVDAMQKVEAANHCSLSQSFRFGPAIADVANHILNEHLNARVNIHGFEQVQSIVGSCASPKAIICRTNATVISTLFNESARGRKASILGGCNELIGLINAADELQTSGSTNHPDLCLFNSWCELQEYAETDVGGDLGTIVRLMSDYDIAELLTLLEKTNQKKSKTDITITTAHKAKGQEWDSVTLTDDFRAPEHKSYTPEESNLLYVAATRAKKQLDISNCSAIY